MILIRISLFFLSVLSLHACKVQYTFTGINIDAETITINNFFNDAEGGPPDLSQVFTDEIREYFQKNTRLNFVDEGGDLIYEGSVVEYRLTPIAPQAGNSPNDFATSAQTRLTISVNVSFTNQKDGSNDFEKRFSFFSQFDSEQSINDVEEQLIQEIYDQIILDIFNATVANW